MLGSVSPDEVIAWLHHTYAVHHSLDQGAWATHLELEIGRGLGAVGGSLVTAIVWNVIYFYLPYQ